MLPATATPRPQYATGLAVGAGVLVAGAIAAVPAAYDLSGPWLTAAGHSVPTGKFINAFLFKGWGWSQWPHKLQIAEAVGGAVVAIGALATAWFTSRPAALLIHSDGAQLRQGAYWLKRALKKESKLSEVLFTAAGIQFTRDRVRRSMLGLGSIGGGKTQSLLKIIEGLISSKHRILLIDGPKGDYSSVLPRGITMSIVAPWHRGMPWDVARDIPTRNHAIQFAKALIPDSKDPLWSNAAQAILIACTCKLIAEQKTAWTWADLYSLCISEIETLYTIAKEYYPPAVESLRDCESKTTQSIVINLHAFLSPVFELAQAWGDPRLQRFSFVDWWAGKKGPQVMILQSSAEFGALSSAYISAIFTRLALLTASPSFAESKTRKNIVVIDEFAQLPKITGLEKFLEIGRSKGCSMLLATQSLAQIRKIWGQDDMQSWMSMLGTKIYARTTGADDIELVQRETGTRKVLLRQASASVSSRAGTITGGSNSTSWQREDRPVISQEDLANLGPDAAAGGVHVIFQGIGSDPVRVLIPFTSWPAIRPVYVENNAFNRIGPAVAETKAQEAAPVPQLAPAQATEPAPLQATATESLSSALDDLIESPAPLDEHTDSPDDTRATITQADTVTDTHAEYIAAPEAEYMQSESVNSGATEATESRLDTEEHKETEGDAVLGMGREAAVHEIGLALGCDLSIAAQLFEVSEKLSSENAGSTRDSEDSGEVITSNSKRCIRVLKRKEMTL